MCNVQCETDRRPALGKPSGVLPCQLPCLVHSINGAVILALNSIITAQTKRRHPSNARCQGTEN
jgi:hypothetical protein